MPSIQAANNKTFTEYANKKKGKDTLHFSKISLHFNNRLFYLSKDAITDCLPLLNKKNHRFQ